MIKGILGLAISLSFSSAWAGQVELGLELKGLGPMKGQHYEGWNIIKGEAYTTGRFSIAANNDVYQVNAAGKPVMKIGANGEASFKVNRKHLKSSAFVLTIEPNGDTDEGPSSVHIMGGNYKSGAANLSIDHGSSLGTNFSNASGSYILAAPTGGEANQGVWFVNPAKGMGSLNLPELPQGWAYEGWIVNTKNGGKFSTGLFQSVNGADSDGAGILAGPLKLSFPPVPGQDIVKSNVVLDDGIHAVVVTVEPYPDFDPAPYNIKILKSDVSYGAPGMTPFMLDNIAQNTEPSGEVHIH